MMCHNFFPVNQARRAGWRPNQARSNAGKAAGLTDMRDVMIRNKTCYLVVYPKQTQDVSRLTDIINYGDAFARQCNPGDLFTRLIPYCFSLTARCDEAGIAGLRRSHCSSTSTCKGTAMPKMHSFLGCFCLPQCLLQTAGLVQPGSNSSHRHGSAPNGTLLHTDNSCR